MPAATYDLYIEQGATYEQEMTVREADTNLPTNLTGYSARMQIRNSVDDSDVLTELTNSNGRIVLGGVNGTILLTMTADDTADLDFDPSPGFSAGKGVYDLEIESGAGKVTRLLKGSVVLDPEVTR